MHELIERLVTGGVVITDGAWGTELQAHGLEVGACPDQWNLSHPELVEEVAHAYVEAGSQIILSNTFGANRFTLDRYHLAEQAAEINRAGARISCRAADRRAKVFASIGPTGIMLMMGETSPDEVRAAFAEQARALAEGGADGIVLETFSDPAELLLGVAAAKETGLPVVACMVFDSGKDHDRTLMGTTPEQAAEKLTEAGADCVGSNCGQGIEGFVSITRRLHAATDRPIWIKANAGLPEIIHDRAVYAQTPGKFAKVVPDLLAAGASFVGGCCGTTPEFIRAVKKELGNRG